MIYSVPQLLTTNKRLISIPFSKSAALAKEIAHAEKVFIERDEARVFLTIELVDFLSQFLSEVHRRQLERLFPIVFYKSTIIDLGVGYGASSVFLACRGYEVIAVEPNLTFCLNLNSLAERYRLKIKVINSTTECISKIPSFNAEQALCLGSLHHCDNPIEALQSVSHHLDDDASIFLIEPVLKLYRSKKWFFDKLESAPEEMGHYGGNEHIYYAWEYKRMLKKSGFKQISAIFPFVLEDSKSLLSRAMTSLLAVKPLFNIASYFSLVPTIFAAKKNSKN